MAYPEPGFIIRIYSLLSLPLFSRFRTNSVSDFPGEFKEGGDSFDNIGVNLSHGSGKSQVLRDAPSPPLMEYQLIRLHATGGGERYDPLSIGDIARPSWTMGGACVPNRTVPIPIQPGFGVIIYN